MKLNLGAGINRLDGFNNLDMLTGWRFEDGLTQYADESVDAITVSHALYAVEEQYYDKIFREFYRVLKPGGVVRITDDATDDPRCKWFGGYPGCATATTKNQIEKYLQDAGFKTIEQDAQNSVFVDKSLIQNLHGDQPKVFFMEGVK